MFRENDLPPVAESRPVDTDADIASVSANRSEDGDVSVTTSSNGRLLIRPTDDADNNNVSPAMPGRLLSRPTEQRVISGRGQVRAITRRNVRVTTDNAASAALSNLAYQRTPRPPSLPRPTGAPSRRVPTLPTIAGQSQPIRQGTASTRNPMTTNSRSSAPNTDSISQDSTAASRMRARNNREEQEGVGGRNIRERLRESRNRLDSLMNTFSSELDRGRTDIAAFQDQRERRRQEQLEEVRDLGRRLGQVASELRQLLEHRRQLRDDIEETISEL